jgi:methanethiol S-methyltransferase
MGRLLSFLYGSASYLFFLCVFVYAIGFVGNLLVPKSIDSGEPAPLAEAVAINALLLGLFAVQHSVMARPGFKRVWTRIVPHSIERSTYVLFASLALALLFWQWRAMPELVWSVQSSGGQAALHLLFAAGWAIVLGSTFMISHAHLFGMKQVHDHLQGKEPGAMRFETPALYRHLRHPIMLGFLIAFWATPRMSWGHLFFAVATTGYILIGVRLEERDLLAAFGERYRAYRQQVPMFLPLPRRRGGAPEAGIPENN